MKKRTHPRRRVADPCAVYKVMSKLQPFTSEEMTSLALPIRVSFEAMRTGRGSESDWSDLAAAINVTVIRSRDIDPLCEKTAGDASDALLRSWNRAQRTGRWGFDGPALLEVEAGIDLHEQICALSTPLQMMDAMRKVLKIRESKGRAETRAVTNEVKK